MARVLRFELHAFGRPYHAARVRLGPRTAESDLHQHADFYELMGVVAGRGLHLLDVGSRLLQAGDVVLVRPHDRHAFSGLPPHGLEFVNVAFPASAWRGFMDLTRVDPERTWETQREPPTFRLGEPGLDAVARTFGTALDRFQTAPAMLDLVRFWSDLLPLAAPGHVPAAVPGEAEHSPPWLAVACAAMRREDNLRRGVPRLLELAQVSAAHLSRTMRAHYGLTPTRFVTDLRLEQAASLLATTTDSVTTIAARCGFASLSYFTRSFRAAHGLAPREFRRRSQRAFVP